MVQKLSSPRDIWLEGNELEKAHRWIEEVAFSALWDLWDSKPRPMLSSTDLLFSEVLDSLQGDCWTLDAYREIAALFKALAQEVDDARVRDIAFELNERVMQALDGSAPLAWIDPMSNQSVEWFRGSLFLDSKPIRVVITGIKQTDWQQAENLMESLRVGKVRVVRNIRGNPVGLKMDAGFWKDCRVSSVPCFRVSGASLSLDHG